MNSTVESATIFCIDDDPATCRSLGALMRSRGLACQEFYSAEEFLRVLDKDAAGAVITDLRMEGMSGLDLQRALSQRASLLPIIVVSGHADVPVTVKLMAGGAMTLLQKPYDEADLLAAIENALQHNAAARSAAERVDSVGSRLRSLSSDECQMLELMIEGHANKTIADEVGASSRTVDRRRRRVLDKMKVDSVAELAKLVTEYRHARSQPHALVPRTHTPLNHAIK